MSFITLEHQLLPLQCLDRIQQLVVEAASKPFHVASTLLYLIVQRTVLEDVHVASLDSFYPKRLVVWNRYYADWVISEIYEVLKRIYNDVVKNCDLSVVIFLPAKVEREIKVVEDFVNTIYNNHIPLQPATHVDLSHIENQCAHIGSVLFMCRSIRNTLAVKEIFEKSPSITNRKSPLWNKLLHTSKSSSLLEGSSDPICLVCRRETLVSDGNFAITDCCSDIFCVSCAKTLFDVPSFQESRCPVCRRSVSAWTDNEHFQRFKTSFGVKTISWLLLTCARRGRKLEASASTSRLLNDE